MRRRGEYLFVNPFLHPPGGGEGVANWMIQVLASRGPLTVLCWDPPDFTEIDRYYGTTLSRLPIKTILVAPHTRRILRTLRIPHYLLKVRWLERKSKELRRSYAHCFSAFNDLDLGPPAVQYVHHPISFEGDNGYIECPWPRNRLALAVWPFYLRFLNHLSQHSLSNIRRNITITNSRWTGRVYQEALKAPVHAVIYPPPLGSPSSYEGARRHAFISVARVDRSKNWPILIEIIRRVRGLGHDVSLTLAGSRFDDSHLAEILQLVQQDKNWLSLHLNKPREVLDAMIAEHQFAIHGMVDEHYGMSVAELVLAGCLTFVHDSGGQVEIVSQPQARYSSVEDAVEKIDEILRDPKKQQVILQSQGENRALLTRERFLKEFNNFIDLLESNDSLQPLHLPGEEG